MRNVGFLHAVCCHLPENCFKNTHTVAMPMAKATTECDGYSGGGGGRKAAAAAAAAATLTQRRRRRTSLLRPGQPPLLRDARDRKRCRVSKRAGSCPASPRGHWQVGPPPPPALRTKKTTGQLPALPSHPQEAANPARNCGTLPGGAPPVALLLPGLAAPAASPECVGVSLLLFLHTLQRWGAAVGAPGAARTHQSTVPPCPHPNSGFLHLG